MVAPSRKRYEASHPVISVRVAKQIYNQLQEARQNGQSYGDVLRVGLGIQKTNLQPLKEKIGSLELEYLDLDELVDKRTVTYPCGRCGILMKVQHDNEKEVCRQALIKIGFCHSEIANCHLE